MAASRATWTREEVASLAGWYVDQQKERQQLLRTSSLAAVNESNRERMKKLYVTCTSQWEEVQGQAWRWSEDSTCKKIEAMASTFKNICEVERDHMS